MGIIQAFEWVTNGCVVVDVRMRESEGSERSEGEVGAVVVVCVCMNKTRGEEKKRASFMKGRRKKE